MCLTSDLPFETINRDANVKCEAMVYKWTPNEKKIVLRKPTTVTCESTESILGFDVRMTSVRPQNVYSCLYLFAFGESDGAGRESEWELAPISNYDGDALFNSVGIYKIHLMSHENVTKARTHTHTRKHKMKRHTCSMLALWSGIHSPCGILYFAYSVLSGYRNFKRFLAHINMARKFGCIPFACTRTQKAPNASHFNDLFSNSVIIVVCSRTAAKIYFI